MSCFSSFFHLQLMVHWFVWPFLTRQQLELLQQWKLGRKTSTIRKFLYFEMEIFIKHSIVNSFSMFLFLFDGVPLLLGAFSNMAADMPFFYNHSSYHCHIFSHKIVAGEKKKYLKCFLRTTSDHAVFHCNPRLRQG